MSSPPLVVTGANGRLGGRLVDTLVERESYRIVPVVRTSDQAARLEQELPAVDAVYTADVTERASVSRCLRRIADEYGSVYGVVHTVGAWGETPIERGDPEAWISMLEVNLTSTYLVFRAVLQHLEDEGRLIAFTSQQGADGGEGGQSAYSAAKAGVLRLVESAARETPDEVSVHAVAPSFIRFDSGEASSEGVEPERIVEICRFLLGPNGPAFDGQVLRAYGSGG